MPSNSPTGPGVDEHVGLPYIELPRTRDERDFVEQIQESAQATEGKLLKRIDALESALRAAEKDHEELVDAVQMLTARVEAMERGAPALR